MVVYLVSLVTLCLTKLNKVLFLFSFSYTAIYTALGIMQRLSKLWLTFFLRF